MPEFVGGVGISSKQITQVGLKRRGVTSHALTRSRRSRCPCGIFIRFGLGKKRGKGDLPSAGEPLSPNQLRVRNSRAGNAFAVRTGNLMGKWDHWWNGDGVEGSTARRRSVVQRGGNTPLVLHSPIGKSAEVRTSQALWNRIRFVECCRRTLGIALAPGTTRWKSI